MNKETFEKAEELNRSIRKLKGSITEIVRNKDQEMNIVYKERQTGAQMIAYTFEDVNELLNLLDAMLKRKEKEFETL